MKRAEILQMAMLRPKFAILDETDSGLDVDAVRLASQSIAQIGGRNMGILIITHHEQLLEHNQPDFTHVMLGGRIVETGGPELAMELHKQGYDRLRAAYPDAAAEELRSRNPATDRAAAKTLRRTRRLGGGRTEVIDMATDLQTSSRDAIGEINKYDFRNEESYVFKARKGLDRRIVAEISEMKGEPAWMRDFRLKSLEIFESKPMPQWGGRINIDFQDIYYYLKPVSQQGRTWDDVPAGDQEHLRQAGHPRGGEEVSRRREGPVRERGGLRLAQGGPVQAGRDLHRHGFGLREYPDLVRQYFSTIIPPTDNKFAALNSAVWSGGSFVYVPPGVKIEFPLQAYFRINAAQMGQFERTLIIVDEGAQVHYVEGCTAPMYSSESLHAAVVEVIGKRGSRVRYTTIQNWANNIYNLVTKRAVAYQDALIEWVDGNLGSRLTMKYPSIYMLEPGARGEVLSVAFASAGQHQDAGAKVVHCAAHLQPHRLQVDLQERRPDQLPRPAARCCKGAKKAKSNVVCDALILDPQSRSDTYPYIEIEEQDVMVGHEASVSRIGEEQLFYLCSRGLSEAEAATMIVSGFIEPLVKELPMEYAVEMNRLIELQMEGTVG